MTMSLRVPTLISFCGLDIFPQASRGTLCKELFCDLQERQKQASRHISLSFASDNLKSLGRRQLSPSGDKKAGGEQQQRAGALPLRHADGARKCPLVTVEARCALLGGSSQTDRTTSCWCTSSPEAACFAPADRMPDSDTSHQRCEAPLQRALCGDAKYGKVVGFPRS